MKRKKPVLPEKSGSSQENSKGVGILLLPSFLRRLRRVGEEEKRRIEAALNAVCDGFESPHLHQGMGIRKLGEGLFECRAGLGLRLVLRAIPGALRFAFVGRHDQVARWLDQF